MPRWERTAKGSGRREWNQAATPWATDGGGPPARRDTHDDAGGLRPVAAAARWLFLLLSFHAFGGLPGVGPPEMGIAADGTKVTYASFAPFCRGGSKMVGTLARMTSAYPNLIALAPV